MKTATFLCESSLSLPADSYIYKILRASRKTSLAVISSDDSLRVFDPEKLQLEAGGVFSKAHEGVTCLETFDADQHCVLTAGRDAAARCWDIRTGAKTFEVNDTSGASYLSLDSRGLKLAAGTELTHSQATVTIWDYRYMKIPYFYTEGHCDDVSRLQFHPSNPSYLLSGSTDGLVNIYNTTIPDEEEALIQIINHGSSIRHAGFLSMTELYALSHDEILSLYHLDNTVANEVPSKLGDLRSVLNCEYIIDIVPSDNRKAIIGAGTHSTHALYLIPFQCGSPWFVPIDEAILLDGAHGPEIVRSMCFDYASEKVFTAGEDGLVKAWKLPAIDEESEKQLEIESQHRYEVTALSKKLKKTMCGKESKERDGGRFAPY